MILADIEIHMYFLRYWLAISMVFKNFILPMFEKLNLLIDPDHTGSSQRHGRQKGKEYDTIFDLYIYLLSSVVFI